MDGFDWKVRARLFIQRFWQPTSACMTCMPGSLGNIWSPAHWQIALQTGLAAGILVLALSFTPLRRLFRNRFGNAAVVGCFTAVGDAFSHPNHYGIAFGEALTTGAVAFALALAASYVIEYFVRRAKAAWLARGPAKT